MSITPQQTEKLLHENYAFSQLCFSMLINRMKAQYAKAPSPSTVQTCTDEINSFLQHFDAIMGDDMAVIAEI